MKFHKKRIHLLLLSGIILALIAIVSLMFSPVIFELTVFPPHLSNSWYPTKKQELRNELQKLDEQANKGFSAVVAPDSIRAMIVPHAGYAYSGDVDAAMYRLVSGSSVRRIMVLGPSHRGDFSGVALPAADAYQIPTGSVTLETNIIKQLIQQQVFTYNDAAYTTEHSIEVQLPFIHHYLPSARVIPLMIGSVSKEQIHEIATALAPFIDTHTLVVVSSDFTHYGTRFDYTPFADHEQLRIQQLDSGAVRAIQDQSLSAFLSYIQQTGATICGRMPIAILLALLEQKVFGAVESRLIAYKTSTEKTGTPDDSVSYVGMLLTTEKRASLPYDDQLTAYEKSALLVMARSVLEQLFDKTIRQELLYPMVSPATSAHQGAFVTLYKNGELRGCIGRTTSDLPLYQTVADMTRAAAFEDSRFSPVTRDELADITLEISVLTAARPVASYNDIVLGTHGIILKKGNKSALFLPKVATEFGWDLPTTLSQLSKKAGLPADAWKGDDVSYQVFESIDFSE